VKEDGGSAYPFVVRNDSDDVYRGMSLRDYFAGQAMAGLAGNPYIHSDVVIARAAYQIADDMLAERSKE
jgi:hypothetical protein